MSSERRSEALIRKAGNEGAIAANHDDAEIGERGYKIAVSSSHKILCSIYF